MVAVAKFIARFNFGTLSLPLKPAAAARMLLNVVHDEVRHVSEGPFVSAWPIVTVADDSPKPKLLPTMVTDAPPVVGEF
jgi:hypothetical protein